MGLKTRGTEEQMIALILVENEVTVGGRYDHWQDVTGKRYQFPNQYPRQGPYGSSFRLLSRGSPGGWLARHGRVIWMRRGWLGVSRSDQRSGGPEVPAEMDLRS